MWKMAYATPWHHARITRAEDSAAVEQSRAAHPSSSEHPKSSGMGTMGLHSAAICPLSAVPLANASCCKGVDRMEP